MTLISRLDSFIDALGADIKSLLSQITNWETAMAPSSVKQINMPGTSAAVNTVTSLSSGRLTLVKCPVKKDQQITAISFFSIGAATSPTHQTFALYDQSRNLIGATSDDTTTAWAANTRKRLVLASPYTPTADGWLYVGILVTASTVPTLGGLATALQITGLAPIAHGHSNTGLAGTPASLPSTANALTALLGIPTVMLD